MKLGGYRANLATLAHHASFDPAWAKVQARRVVERAERDRGVEEGGKRELRDLLEEYKLSNPPIYEDKEYSPYSAEFMLGIPTEDPFYKGVWEIRRGKGGLEKYLSRKTRKGTSRTVPGTVIPLQYVYRAISADDFRQARENGYLQSHGKENIYEDEGTVVEAVRSPRYYLPDNADGYMVKIAVTPDVKWELDDRTGYVHTRDKIPFEHIVDAVKVGKKQSQQMFDRIRGTHTAEENNPRKSRSKYYREYEELYHGTPYEFEQFDPHQNYRFGHFFTDNIEVAREYKKKGQYPEGKVIKAKVKGKFFDLGDVKKLVPLLRANGYNKKEISEIWDGIEAGALWDLDMGRTQDNVLLSIARRGYDGAILPDFTSPSDVGSREGYHDSYIVFSPQNIEIRDRLDNPLLFQNNNPTKVKTALLALVAIFILKAMSNNQYGEAAIAASVLAV